MPSVRTDQPGPWGFELMQMGNQVGFASLVARCDNGTNDNDAFAKVGVSSRSLAAPGGDLRILDGSTGELFRFDDLNRDGDHYFIQGDQPSDGRGRCRSSLRI